MASVVVDASVMVALCANEAGRYARAQDELARLARSGFAFYAPGVFGAEVLFALCHKLQNGSLDVDAHDQATKQFELRAGAILPPPRGDAALIRRAEAIRTGYGCSRSADGLYIALAEELSEADRCELLTFDGGMPAQAAANAPTVTVRLL